jgi:hypothetical protein
MRMKKPEDDISLRDGLGYMVESGPYRNHLDSSSEIIQVCSIFLDHVLKYS